MVLILGAAHAGKRDAARKLYTITEFADGGSCDLSQVMAETAICDYHVLVRRLLASGQSPQDFTKRYISENPNAIVLMNEIGCGIVPLEREERIWREECGICARMIAENADTVIRVVCGIPQAIKGELP